MSSQTPNLGLTLPTGSENVSRQIINDNNTIIDDAYGTVSSDITALNSNLKVHDLGTISTLSGFQSALDTMVTGITGVGFYVFEFTAYFSGGGFSPFNVSNSQIFGKLTIAGTSRYNIEVYNHADINRIWRGIKLVDTWAWDRISLNAGVKSEPYLIDQNSSKTITIAGYGLVACSWGGGGGSGTLTFLQPGGHTDIVTGSGVTITDSGNNHTITNNSANLGMRVIVIKALS